MTAPPQPGVVLAELVFEEAPHAQCHASTIVEVRSSSRPGAPALLAAWFGGTREKHPDVGIWLSRRDREGWSLPEEVANGVQESGERYPCWNPVLFQPAGGPVLLFYKVGPSPSEWWGMLKTSEDGGRSWSEPRRLPDGILGPIKNKPIELEDGSLLCGSSTEHDGWRVHLERTTDLESWERIGPVADGSKLGAIQPALLSHGGGRLQMLCRSRAGRIVESWSRDGGRTWSELVATRLPNPNSGIDAVTLVDGRQLLVYNHAAKPPARWGGPRSPLNVALSDDGRTWLAAATLENEEGEFSYPAVIQSVDGRVHVTYTHRRRHIKHVVLDPAKLELRQIESGR